MKYSRGALKADPFSFRTAAPGSNRPMRGSKAWRYPGVLSALVLSLAVLAGCSGGDSGPTGPNPPPGPVVLFGMWQGSMTATRADTGQQMTCGLTMELVDAGDPGIEIGLGSWEASCPDGTRGGDLATGVRILFELVIVSAFPGEPFAGCGWGGTAQLTAGRLTGDWMVTDGCAEPWSGRFDLSL